MTITAWGYWQLAVCWCNLQRSGSNRKCVGSRVGCHYNHQTYLFHCILYEIVSPRKHIKRCNCSCSWSLHCYFKVLLEILFYSRRRAGTIEVHEYTSICIFYYLVVSRGERDYAWSWCTQFRLYFRIQPIYSGREQQWIKRQWLQVLGKRCSLVNWFNYLDKSYSWIFYFILTTLTQQWKAISVFYIIPNFVKNTVRQRIVYQRIIIFGTPHEWCVNNVD